MDNTYPIHFSNLNLAAHIINHNNSMNPAAAIISSLNVRMAASSPRKIDGDSPSMRFAMDPNKNENPTHRLTSNTLDPNAFDTAISIFICRATITDEIQSGNE